MILSSVRSVTIMILLSPKRLLSEAVSLLIGLAPAGD